MALINRNQRLNGLNPLSYVGVDSYQPPEFVTDNRAPTASDARNFYLGTLWLDISGYPVTLPTAENIWMLVALVGNQATWVHFGSGGIMTLTGNTGGPVSPDGAFNINVVGDTTTINIAGNPGTNTLTVSTVGTGVVSSLTGDSGGAVFPTAGNINLLGTAGKITTTGTPGTHQIVWNLDGSVAQSFPTDAGTATPAANALTIKANVAAQGSGSSVEFTGSGSTVLLNVTDANNNTIIGKSSGNATLTSTNCTVLGEGSFSAATSSSNSVIIGQGAANAITSGGGHVIIGQGAGSALSGTETNNVLINSSGVAGKNTFFCLTSHLGGGFIHNYPGQDASTSNGGNVFLGGGGNFTLAGGAGNASNNTVGGGSLEQLTLGARNDIHGTFGGRLITTGSQNSGLGHSVMYNAGAGTGLTTGIFNVALGYTAGTDWTGAGDSKVIRIGTFTLSGAGSAIQTKCFIQGIAGITTVVNDAVAVLISASTGQLGTISSSARYKDNIEDMGSYSDVLHKLRPVTFNYKKHSSKDKTVGLIAEEVALEEPRLVVYDKDGLPETVKYHELVPMLLNEVQKLRKELDDLKKRL